MPVNILFSLHKRAQRNRFFKNLNLVGCHADEKFSVMRQKFYEVAA